MADRSPSRRGQLSAGSRSGSASTTVGPVSSLDSHAPQPHRRRPPTGTWTGRPQLPHCTEMIRSLAFMDAYSTPYPYATVNHKGHKDHKGKDPRFVLLVCLVSFAVEPAHAILFRSSRPSASRAAA